MTKVGLILLEYEQKGELKAKWELFKDFLVRHEIKAVLIDLEEGLQPIMNAIR